MARPILGPQWNGRDFVLVAYAGEKWPEVLSTMGLSNLARMGHDEALREFGVVPTWWRAIEPPPEVAE